MEPILCEDNRALDREASFPAPWPSLIFNLFLFARMDDVCFSVWGSCSHNIHGSQNRTLDPLELELQAARRCRPRMVNDGQQNLGPSAEAVRTLNCSDTSAA